MLQEMQSARSSSPEKENETLAGGEEGSAAHGVRQGERQMPALNEQAQAAEQTEKASSQSGTSSGTTDLLLRLFSSDFFDEWIALSYLWRSQSPGVHDYLCNRVWTLSDEGVERYLHQFCALLITRPSSSLEHTIVGLCKRSLRIALKVWLFIRSLSEDSTASLGSLRPLLHRCEKAACASRWLAPVVLPLPPGWESFHHHDTGTTPWGSYADFHGGYDDPQQQQQQLHSPTGDKDTHASASSESGTSCCTDAVEGIKHSCKDTISLARQDSNSSSSETRPEEGCGSSSCFSCADGIAERNNRDYEATTNASTVAKHLNSATFDDSAPGSPEGLERKPPTQRWSREACASAFCKTRSVIDELCNLGLELKDVVGKEARQHELRRRLTIVSESFGNGSPVLFPLGKGPARMLRIPPDEAILLNSREKAPYFICVEVLEEEHHDFDGEGMNTRQGSRRQSHGPTTENEDANDGLCYQRSSRSKGSCNRALWQPSINVGNMNVDEDRLVVSPSGGRHHRVSSSVALERLAEQRGDEVAAEPRDDKDVTSPSPARTKYDERPARAHASNGEHERRSASSKAGGKGGVSEAFSEKRERVREESPYGSLQGWRLKPVIVKTGDDCRQELLAAQITGTFQTIFHEAGLPLWLRPYEVFVSGARAALMEAVPDAPSLHSVKSRMPGLSLLEHFKQRFGPRNTQKFKDAQRAFIESLAAYSLVSYILQLKDRHNGNILLDSSGHIINIDFSFMLSTTPGGINFESAPFKLTREFLEVMDSDADGMPSDSFNYFKVLVIQGFLAARKHAERIVQLVEILQPTNCPCFKGGARTISQLKRRFRLDLTEEQCVEHVLSLISDSLDAWSTRQYDNYQALVVGIQQ